MTQKQLLKTINQAAREGTTVLDLSIENLTALPPEITNLTNLTSLYLHENKLTTLPPEIGNLTSLTWLLIGDNQLTALPPEIGNLTSLTELHLGVNQLTTLGPEIANLTSLTELDLWGNQLTTLPPEITNLTSLTKLWLWRNQLTTLPPEIGNLTSLTTLFLYDNKLTTLPPEIGNLTDLTDLVLKDNQLTTLPLEIGNLTSLTNLDLGGNQFTTLPPEIGNLINLTSLYLTRNRLSALPPAIGNLTSLTTLGLRGNQLTELPRELGKLTRLTELYLGSNQLTEIPPELGKLTRLQNLRLSENPLTSPPPEVDKQGTEAVLAFLRARLEKGRRQWVSKLIVVGEGEVGKTAMLRSLKGLEFDPNLPTTHGIFIDKMEFKHPTEPDVTMHLNTWDFGGQEIYHATHQFFLTNRSLFILVWNTRMEWEQCRLYDWLNTIKARAPESPVIIVATRTEEHQSVLPRDNILSQYPQVKGFCDISNETDAGVEELRQAIAEAAAGLPLMGEEWPADWLNAAEAVRAHPEKHITPHELDRIMAGHNVEPSSRHTLSTTLHELGDILWFKKDDELKNLVILKPQWVSEYVCKVLDSKEVKEGIGLLSRELRDRLWSDLPEPMRDHFLRLMERFDLSYRTQDNREISLVVERLQYDPPKGWQEFWDQSKQAECCREVTMRYRFGSNLPPGIPTWFIARAHRFTTHTHWRTGAVFADSEERRHLALVSADRQARTVELSVRGPMPHNFMALLRDGFELTLARYQGLEFARLIPCPGHDGQPCEHEFSYADLDRAIEQNPPVLEIQCSRSFKPISVPGLLFGIHWRTEDRVMEKLDGLDTKLDRNLDKLAGLRTLVQREFINTFAREQAKIESHCPNVFVLRPLGRAGWLKKLIGQKVELQLYCQAPGCWHPTTEGGRYVINDPASWLKTTGPLIARLVKYLKYVAPLAGPWVGGALPEYEKLIKNDLKFMAELVKVLPDLEPDREPELRTQAGEHIEPGKAGGAPLRAIRRLLDKKDPNQHWGGLKKVLTPEGHYLWLCEHHAKEYKQ